MISVLLGTREEDEVVSLEKCYIKIGQSNRILDKEVQLKRLPYGNITTVGGHSIHTHFFSSFAFRLEVRL